MIVLSWMVPACVGNSASMDQVLKIAQPTALDIWLKVSQTKVPAIATILQGLEEADLMPQKAGSSCLNWLPMHTHMYVCTHTHYMHTYTHTHACHYKCVNMHMHIHAHMHICTYTHFLYTHIYSCIYSACGFVIQTPTHTNVYIHTYIELHTYTV